MMLVVEKHHGEVLKEFADRLGNTFPSGKCCLVVFSQASFLTYSKKGNFKRYVV